MADSIYALAEFPNGTMTNALAKRLHVRVPHLRVPSTDCQRLALSSLASDVRASHEIEFRVSIPTLFWGTRYFTVFSGLERRSEERLQAEGQTKWTRRSLFFFAIVLALTSFALFGVFCLLYLLKSVLGLNLLSSPSPFHPLYSLFLAR
jgi:hypothetical protein